MITLKNVSKSFVQWSETIDLYNNLALHIQDWEFVMITGQSGSGKTTLFNIIAWLESADSGKLIVNNTDISDLSDDERTIRRARTIWFVFQKFYLVPQLTVRENLELLWDLTDLQKRYTVEYILKRVGLAKKINIYPDQLSGWEQQRVAIARAFLYQTPLLLADEPTGNLDLWNSKNIMQLIKELQKDTWVTIVMITHESQMLTRADRVVTMKELTIAS